MEFRRDRSSSRYGSESLHGAPHKPFLMLAILQGIEEGRITDSNIEPTEELEISFWERSNSLDIGRKRDMWLPFFHMKSEPFWTLIRHDGMDSSNDSQPRSTIRLRETYRGARLDDDLWSIVSTKDGRDALLEEIMVSNFHPDVHQTIREMERIAILSNSYAEKILGMQPVKNSQEDAPVRNAGFRKAIQRAYNHTCAFTGIRLLTPSFHTIIDAAHIIPWSVSHDDSLENGIALSKHCHWAFDRGMLTVDKDGCIRVSRRLRDERMFAPGLIDLEGRHIQHPSGEYKAPSEIAFDYHRKQVFVR